MAELNRYTFNNVGRLSSDVSDLSQQNLDNTRYAEHNLSNFNNNVSNHHVKFAVEQPTLNYNGLTHGNGLNPIVIDDESKLVIKTSQQRAFEKLQLFQRPFSTIPYLGRGSCDTNIETGLLHGESVSDKKSTSTVMDRSFTDYSLQPEDQKMKEFVEDPSNTVEEAALSGWVRGGMNTREMTMEEAMQNYNGSNTSF